MKDPRENPLSEDERSRDRPWQVESPSELAPHASFSVAPTQKIAERVGGPRILIVDDSQPFLAAVEDLLTTGSEFEIVGRASSGRQALELAARLRPDLVLMDLTMPDIGGLEATRRLLATDDPPPIVIMTAHEQPEYRDAAEKAGASGFLVKDDLDAELLPLIESLLNAEIALDLRSRST